MTPRALVKAHRWIVAWCLSKRKIPPGLREECSSAAWFGLWDAAQRFDETRGVKFPTYATYRVRGEISAVLRAQQNAKTPTKEDALACIGQPSEIAELDARAREVLAGLSFTDRELLIEHFLNGKTLQQIGDETTRSKSWMSRLMQRALENAK